MSKPRVLYICHNHPSTRPGGAEAYALELYRAVKQAGQFDPVILCKGGPPNGPSLRSHPGTMFRPVNDDPNQYFVLTEGYAFDWVYGTITDKEFYTKHFHEFLRAIRPDIVHFQHTLFLGYDLIRQVKNSLPDAKIVYTLHEFLPICHRQGQMLRVGTNEPCMEANPRRCSECFPGVTPQAFFMRKRFIQSHFELVDLFIAPSRFLMERFIDWGLPREKLLCEEYGRLLVQHKPARKSTIRNRFAFFGQISPYKGVQVLLTAMIELTRNWLEDSFASDPALPDSTPHLWIHGANLDIQEGSFQNTFRELLGACGEHVTLVGRYDHDSLASLMENIDWVVVPSIWWENSPLVIQEAFAHGKPVICSDIGGIAEKVANGVNGLHFKAGDATSLAQTIRRAVTTPGLWDLLAGNIPDVYSMDQHLETVHGIYRDLLAQRYSEGHAYANIH